VFCTASPIPTKALYRALGFDVGDTRLPLDMNEITEAQVETLQKVVHELGELGLKLPEPASATT
jgi:dihydrodipicolinate synthase/N-acetylneuraminate lyase